MRSLIMLFFSLSKEPTIQQLPFHRETRKAQREPGTEREPGTKREPGTERDQESQAQRRAEIRAEGQKVLDREEETDSLAEA